MADNFGQAPKPPVLGGQNSGYSPYGGGGYLPSVNAYGGYAGPPSAPSTMPGYNVTLHGLLQNLAQAQAAAGTARTGAKQTRASNLQAIQSSAADRGASSGSSQVIPNQKENDAYANAMAQIAQQLQGARANEQQGVAQLHVQNAQALNAYNQALNQWGMQMYGTPGFQGWSTPDGLAHYAQGRTWSMSPNPPQTRQYGPF
jgi:hypothetical protein